jgi:hypothetical protein
MNARAATTGASVEYIWKDPATGKMKKWKAKGACGG